MDVKIVNYNNHLFSRNIDYLTKKKNITKKHIESELELGAGALSRYCRSSNASKPGIEIIINLSNFLGVKIDDLINTDLEIKDEKEIKNKQRKEVITCQKLIDETNKNSHNWTRCDLTDGYVHSYSQNNMYYFDEILAWPSDDTIQYSSKFLCETFNIDMVETFIVDIEEDISVLIFQIFLDNKNNKYNHDFNYEVYFIKKSEPIYEILSLCSGYNCEDIFSNEVKFDQDIYSIVKELYETVNYYNSHGKERHEIEDICDRYLQSREPDLPF